MLPRLSGHPPLRICLFSSISLRGCSNLVFPVCPALSLTGSLDGLPGLHWKFFLIRLLFRWPSAHSAAPHSAAHTELASPGHAPLPLTLTTFLRHSAGQPYSQEKGSDDTYWEKYVNVGLLEARRQSLTNYQLD